MHINDATQCNKMHQMINNNTAVDLAYPCERTKFDMFSSSLFSHLAHLKLPLIYLYAVHYVYISLSLFNRFDSIAQFLWDLRAFVMSMLVMIEIMVQLVYMFIVSVTM